LDPKRLRELLQDFQAGVIGALFELTEVAATNPGFICKVILRKSLFVAQAATAFLAWKTALACIPKKLASNHKN
jgi:hypothetical protein